LGKATLFTQLVERARAAGKVLQVYNVGKRMCEERGVDEQEILKLPLPELGAIRRGVFKEIISDVGGRENSLIETHATFRWENALFPAFDYNQFRQLAPDAFATLIDDVDSVWVRLKEAKPGAEYTLKDLMVWREEEMIVTETVAGVLERPHYIIPRRDALDLLYSLIFEPNKRRAYMSFPMSLIRDMPELIRDVEQFKETMKKQFIAFDPAAIGEKRLHYELQQVLDSMGVARSIEIEILNKSHRVDVRQLLDLIPDIDGQIVYRDFKLIDQSQMIVAYIPVVFDSPYPASGVERELEYAHNTAKDAFVICQRGDKLSPFVTKRASRVFATFEQALAYFKSKKWV